MATTKKAAAAPCDKKTCKAEPAKAVKETKATTKATKTKALKPAKVAAKPAKAAKAKTADDNLKRLAKSKLPGSFVKKHNGAWNHDAWLAFLAELEEKGFLPINIDFVGLILEEEKIEFFK